MFTTKKLQKEILTEVKDWLDIGKKDEAHKILDDDTVVQSVTATADCETHDDEEQEEAAANRRSYTINHNEAETMLTKCNVWFKVPNEAGAMQVLLLHKICNMVSQKLVAS